jgi:transposase
MPQNFIECGREQVFLMPPSLLEWVPEDHLAWTILASVEEMDLGAFYADYRADGHGRPAYEPKMMVALLLYAYAKGNRSSRGIERACSEDVAYRVICSNHAPDHSTIAEFRVRHERALADLFGEVLGLCGAAGLVRVGLIAIDGTKVSANASIDANRSYEQIAREILEEARRIDEAEDELYGEARGDELPERLRTREGRRAALREAKRKLAAEREARATLSKLRMMSPSSRWILTGSGWSIASRVGVAGCGKGAASWMSCASSRPGRSPAPGPSDCASQSGGWRKSTGSSSSRTLPMRRIARVG